MKILIRKLGRKVKAWYYRNKYHLKNVDKTVYFGGKSAISKDVIIGRYSYIGPRCNIQPNVKIGEFTMLANNVSIIGGDHRYDIIGKPIILAGRDVIKETTIGSDCWIGAHSIIMNGVHIADGCIIAAGAVVTKNTEPYSIYGGVPAKKIRARFNSEKDLNQHIEKKSLIREDDILNMLLKNDKLILAITN